MIERGLYMWNRAANGRRCLFKRITNERGSLRGSGLTHPYLNLVVFVLQSEDAQLFIMFLKLFGLSTETFPDLTST